MEDVDPRARPGVREVAGQGADRASCLRDGKACPQHRIVEQVAVDDRRVERTQVDPEAGIADELPGQLREQPGDPAVVLCREDLLIEGGPHPSIL